MKNITDADYTQTKMICKDFKVKNLNTTVCVIKVIHCC